MHLMQKHTDVDAKIFCTYIEGGDGDPFNKEYFRPKS